MERVVVRFDVCASCSESSEDAEAMRGAGRRAALAVDFFFGAGSCFGAMRSAGREVDWEEAFEELLERRVILTLLILKTIVAASFWAVAAGADLRGR